MLLLAGVEHGEQYLQGHSMCRQKTDCEKTRCVCAQSGGRANGTWCGNCLWVRMGQNVHEVNRLPPGEWRCPVCLVRSPLLCLNAQAPVTEDV